MNDNRLLVSLDLDEAIYYRADQVDEVTHRPPDAVLSGSLSPYLYLRPYARELLQYLATSEDREFGFFTASIGEGTDSAIAFLTKIAGKSPAFYFDRKRVIYRYVSSIGPYSNGTRVESIKDLKKVKSKTGFNINDILAIDDNSIYPRQYGNLWKVSVYFPFSRLDETDRELLDIRTSLEKYTHKGNIRKYLKELKE